MEETHDHNDNNTVKSVVILGDSMLNNIIAQGISKDGNVKVKSFAGSTSEVMKDHINPTICDHPTIREQPDAIILHIASNDIGKDIDAISNIQILCHL